MVEEGWGAEYGFPALVLNDGGELVTVEVLESPDLPEHWRRLDEFEGAAYRRVRTLVCTGQGLIEASIYVLAAMADEHDEHDEPS